LQGRNFSYLDTQLNRFSGPNFHQLPVNQSRAPVNNFQQDSFMRYANRPGRVNYEPNSLGPQVRESPASQGGFVSFPEHVDGDKVRQRSDSFGDHFSQATLFFQSMSEPEKRHIIQALQFELGKVTVRAVQERMLTRLANIDSRLVREVAAALGLPVPPGNPNTGIGTSPALSQLNTVKTPATRRVAILAADGMDAGDVAAIQQQLAAAGAHADVVAPHLGSITAANGRAIAVTATFLTAMSVQYDAVYLPGGPASVTTLQGNGDAVHFVEEAYKHFKPIAATGDGRRLLATAVGNVESQPGIVVGASGTAVGPAFVQAIAQHRHWDRQGTDAVSA
jgi:catalase